MTSSRVPLSLRELVESGARRAGRWFGWIMGKQTPGSLALGCVGVVVLSWLAVLNCSLDADDTTVPPNAFSPELQHAPNVWVLDGTNSAAIDGSALTTVALVDSASQGINGRFGHITGPTVGRRESMTYFELSPFVGQENTFFAGDFRLLRTNHGRLAGSAGLIMRHFLPNRNVILGANAFYDVDDTRVDKFEEFSVGLELLSARLDIRTNLYFPTGSSQQVLNTGIVPGSTRFEGNNILFDTFDTTATAARGIDMLFTMPIPGARAEAVNLEASAGWYHFAPKESNVRDTTGWRIRLDGSGPRKIAHLFFEVTGDRVFDNNFVVGADLNYWHGRRHGPRIKNNQLHRIAQWVNRNWTVTTIDETFFTNNVVAVNPATGTPYYIEHVDTNAPFNPLGANGTFLNPYNTLTDAQTMAPGPSPNNIIYVHAGSQFTAPIVMNAGENIIGEGASQTLAIPGYGGSLTLPLTGKAGGLPNVDGVNGVAVTLADDTLFAGFSITNTTGGPAILGNMVNNTTLNSIQIENVNGGSGIVFNSSTGLITLDDVNILRSNPLDPMSGTDDDAFVVDGGFATIFYRDSTIENSLARAVRITNGAGGTINLSSLTINTFDTDEGVIVENSSANVTFGPISLQNGTLDLQNITGNISFLSPVTISASMPNPDNLTGIPLSINGSTGLVSFGPAAPVTISNRPDVTAIDLRNISGTTLFNADITIGAASGPGLVWQENSGAFISNGAFLANGQTEGILIGSRFGMFSNTAGSTFTMNGQFTILDTFGRYLVSAGPPQVFDQNAAIEILNDPTDVVFSGGRIEGRNPMNNNDDETRGIEIVNTTGSITFNGLTVINNQLDINDTDSPFAAVSMQMATGPILFNHLDVNDGFHDTMAEPAVFGDMLTDITFNRIDAEYFGTTAVDTPAVLIQNSGNVVSGEGFLNAMGAAGISLLNNTSINWTSTSISADTAMAGITVTDSPGSFVVTGQFGGAGSGGTIDGTGDGAIFTGAGLDPTDPANFISLNNMVFNANGTTAVTATNYNSVTLNNVSVTGAGTGVQTTDVINLSITDSTFLSNGTYVNADVMNNPTGEVYTYRIERNSFTDTASSTGSMIAINNLAGGAGATLDLIVRDNGTQASGVTGFLAMRSDASLTYGASAIAVNWNGPVTQALIERNSFLLMDDNGIGQSGVSFFNASAGDMSFVTYRQNILTSINTATDSIGAIFDFTGTTTLTVEDNSQIGINGQVLQGMTMNGLRDEAFRITFRGGGNTMILEDNLLTLANDDTIAFNFPFIGGDTFMRINGNIVNHIGNFTAGGPGERGFTFGPVVGLVTFSGNRNNEVNYLSPDIFSLPFPTAFPGPHIGSFILNNQLVP